MAQKILIKIKKLGKTYKRDLFKKRTALSDLSLSVKTGEVFGIVGPNGAGKSTLLKILLGLIKSDKGTIHIDGSSPADPQSRTNIGFLPESPCLYPHLTITDHLKFIASCHDMTSNIFKSRLSHVLDRVELTKVANTKLKKFSKGMMQRAALACAIFTEPKILILDEPMSGLDPLGRKMVTEIICNYHKKGHTVLFCSHILTDIEKICDRIGIMADGQLIATLTPFELEAITPSHSFQTPLESIFFDLIGSKKDITP